MNRFYQLLILLVFISTLLGIPVKALGNQHEITLALVGDVMLARNVAKITERYPPEWIWGNTINILKGADLTLMNLEFSITNSEKRWDKTEKTFHFRATPFIMPVIKTAGFDYASLANNHVLDYEEKGLADTIDILNKNNIAHAGAGRNLEEAKKHAMLVSSGVKVAVISITDNMPEWSASKNQAGVFYIPIKMHPIGELVRKARKDGADLVILSMHWGHNWPTNLSSEFVEWAHAAIDSGVDIIHGHSPHVIQGIEIYKGKPIFYGMGDLIDDYVVKPRFRNNLSFIAKITIEKNPVKISKIDIIPTSINSPQVDLAHGKKFAWVYRKLRDYSRMLGTVVINKKNKIWIPINQ